MEYREVIQELKTMARLRSDERLAAFAERMRVRAFNVGLASGVVVFVLLAVPFFLISRRLLPSFDDAVFLILMLLNMGLSWFVRRRVVQVNVFVAMSRGAGECGLAICSKCGYIMDAPGAERCPECEGEFLSRRRGVA